MKVDVFEMPNDLPDLETKKLPSFRGRSLISVDDLCDEEVDHLFSVVDSLKKGFNRKNLLEDKTVACLFYEASTRTYSSFIAAASKLGCSVIPIQGVAYSSVSKGENLHDSIRTLSQYSNLIVLRHPENEAAKEAAYAASLDGVPVINAGSGSFEHPSQAWLDLYTIKSRLKDPSNKVFSFVGDLKYSRTIHSLIKLLCRYKGIKINLVAPDGLALPDDLKQLASKFCQVAEVPSIIDAVKETDVFYLTRLQTERMSQEEKTAIFDKSGDKRFALDPSVMENAKPTSMILHPLPRQAELSNQLDSDPRAAYFEQVKNGLFVRQALLACVFGRELGIL